ncbi:MAG TPA: radical SAM protein [Bryobacteraceae bacterium]|nr:radical SAM protein [Bryobacteraceae bacterium]
MTNRSLIDLDSSGAHPTYLAYHWLDLTGAPIRLDAGRFHFAQPLAPGDSREWTVAVETPETPGGYLLRMTLVQEWVRWFDEPQVGAYFDTKIEVKAEPWWTHETQDQTPYSHIPLLNRAVFKERLSYEGKARPLMLHVETVNICNLKCIICPYAEMTRKRETMGMQLFAKIVSDYCDMGGGDVVLTPQVGDVFLDKLLVPRIRYLREMPGIRSIGFVTNGVSAHVVSEADLEYIVNACDRIKISVYGLDEEEYAAMTLRQDRYQRMVESVRRMIRVNRRCTLVIAARLLKKRDDAFIQSWMNTNFGCALPCTVMTSFGNWAGAIDTSVPLPFDGTWLSAETARSLESGGPCAYPIYHLKVVVNGDVQFCSCVDYDSNAENKIGNVNEEPLSAIYNGERARRLWREGLSMCKGCTHRLPLSDLPTLVKFFASPIRGLGV